MATRLATFSMTLWPVTLRPVTLLHSCAHPWRRAALAAWGLLRWSTPMGLGGGTSLGRTSTVYIGRTGEAVTRRTTAEFACGRGPVRLALATVVCILIGTVLLPLLSALGTT